LTARGAATRSRIVEAAADLICAHGVERTSLDDVMAASGVSKSQPYHYFADKDALVLEVIAGQTERVHSRNLCVSHLRRSRPTVFRR
jgi:AcrR family transcriptional regulator